MNNSKENKKKELKIPHKFNPRILKVDMKDERFFAFESQKSHH